MVAGLIGFTYVFVNALPSATVPDSDSTTTTTAAVSTSSTTSSTTTTTLPPEIAAFVEAADGFTATGEDLLNRVNALNEAWDAEEAGFGATRDGLIDVRADTLTLAGDLSDTVVPASAGETWTAVTSAADEMATAAAGMVDGLVNAPGPEARQAALADFQQAAEDFAAALDAARTAAVG